MKQIKYYYFCIRWLWQHRDERDCRQKYKRMERDYSKAVKA